MTPYEFAQDLRDDLDTLTVPKQVLAQVGDIIIDCQGTWVTVANTTRQDLIPGSPHCGQIDMGDIQIAAAFECSLTSDETGITDPDKLAKVSQEQSNIADTLTTYIGQVIGRDGTFSGIQFQNNGNLGIVIATFSMPIP
jgi:hypothetical protein